MEFHKSELLFRPSMDKFHCLSTPKRLKGCIRFPWFNTCRKSAHFRVGQSLNPYPSHYRTAFAFSDLLYPLTFGISYLKSGQYFGWFSGFLGGVISVVGVLVSIISFSSIIQPPVSKLEVFFETGVFYNFSWLFLITIGLSLVISILMKIKNAYLDRTPHHWGALPHHLACVATWSRWLYCWSLNQPAVSSVVFYLGMHRW